MVESNRVLDPYVQQLHVVLSKANVTAMYASLFASKWVTCSKLLVESRMAM